MKRPTDALSGPGDSVISDLRISSLRDDHKLVSAYSECIKVGKELSLVEAAGVFSRKIWLTIAPPIRKWESHKPTEP